MKKIFCNIWLMVAPEVSVGLSAFVSMYTYKIFPNGILTFMFFWISLLGFILATEYIREKYFTDSGEWKNISHE